MDPSEHCGYNMDSQLRILSDIKMRFSDIPVIEVENKADISKSNSQRVKISALEGLGVDELRRFLVENLIDNKN
jgi:nucleolar GTP-binding protein